MPFTDPRVARRPSTQKAPDRTTAHADELTELHTACRDGRLYDVERWIQDGRPLQIADASHKRRPISALEIALQAGNHALVSLLLSNGYESNRELHSPLDIALRARRFDLVHLLLEWGTDPHRVDLNDLFDTYSTDLYSKFRELGVDLTAGHALAGALAYHTSNKPLFGYAKRTRATDAGIQRELDIALAHHAGEGNEKGVQLCLWSGADPHARVPSLRYSRNDDDEGTDGFDGFSAVYEACQRGDEKILERLRPDPARDDIEELWRVAGSAAVVRALSRYGLPRNVGPVVQHCIWWTTFSEGWRWMETLRSLFEVGVRWTQTNPEELANVRRLLLKASDRIFVDLLKLLATEDYCSTEVLTELARTSAMRSRLRAVGFLPSADDRNRLHQFRPTRSREVLKKFGVEVPQPTPAKATPRVRRSARIRPADPRGEPIHLDRADLFERVWSKPVATVAKECGISGPGLKKVCRRLGVPVPPRGYWAKLRAGKPVRRPVLSSLSSD